MAKYIYKGHSVTGGSGEGQAAKCSNFLPIRAIGKKEIKTALSGAWINGDNKNGLGGVNIAGRVLFVDSISADGYSEAVMNAAVKNGVAPLAILFREKCDTLIANMAICTALCAEKGLILVDRLGDKPFDFAADGDKVIIKEDGTVIIEKITALSV